MTKKIFEKFLNNIEIYRTQIGYYDIISQFFTEFKEEEKMINILSNKKRKN